MQEPYLFYEHEYSPILLDFLSALPLQPIHSFLRMQHGKPCISRSLFAVLRLS